MDSNKTITLPVKGMHCASCASTIQRKLSKVPGVTKAESYFGTEEAVITYDEAKTGVHKMNEALQPLGYELQASGAGAMDHSMHGGGEHQHADIPQDVEVEREQHEAQFGLPLAVLILFGMLWEIAAQNISAVPVLPLPEPLWMLIQFLLASVMLVGIGQVFMNAVWLFLRFRKANMDTLVGIGTLAAYIYSVIGLFFPAIFMRFALPQVLYFDVVIVVIGFVKYGKYLEANSKRKTGEALRSLMQLQVKTASVKRGQEFVEVAIEMVQLNDVVQVKPGANIPIDGEVIEGESSVDESMMTGESLPTSKKVGDQVIGGTLNTHGVLIIKATKVGTDTVLAHIIHTVKEAQNSKAPIERLADQVSAVFVPVVLVVAILTFIGWVFLGSMWLPLSQAMAFGLSCMIAVLVIACPCALGLATPTAIIVGVGQAAKKGILIKNAESLEQLQSVTSIVFDKTGTLTTGKPTVQRVIPFQKLKADQVLRLSAALEQHSEHPLARAVLQHAKDQKIIKLPSVTQFQNLAGEGVVGVVDGQKYWMGSEQFALKKLGTLSGSFQAEPGESVLYLLHKEGALAAITVSDELKPTSRQAVQELKKMGLNVVMLSGDRQATAQYLAAQVGIDQAIGEVKPDQKLTHIKKLQQQGEIVAMVGDGVNDAPALAAANVGIAMSTGTDVAISTAQATILKGDLQKVVTVIALSKSVMRVVKQNLFWAFGYNVVGIPLAAGVLYPFFGLLLSPAFAGMAMGFSSASVVLNSLRLKMSRVG
jgi:P-type Cu+ transporter